MPKVEEETRKLGKEEWLCVAWTALRKNKSGRKTGSLKRSKEKRHPSFKGGGKTGLCAWEIEGKVRNAHKDARKHAPA